MTNKMIENAKKLEMLMLGDDIGKAASFLSLLQAKGEATHALLYCFVHYDRVVSEFDLERLALEIRVFDVEDEDA